MSTDHAARLREIADSCHWAQFPRIGKAVRAAADHIDRLQRTLDEIARDAREGMERAEGGKAMTAAEIAAECRMLEVMLGDGWRVTMIVHSWGRVYLVLSSIGGPIKELRASDLTVALADARVWVAERRTPATPNNGAE